MLDPSEIVAARHALGRLLAKHRQAAGLNQHQLAPHTHYGRSTIANGETGRQNVPRDFDRHHRDTDLLKLRGRSESGLTRTQVRQEEEIRR